jgi:hypothetical protein
MKTKKTYSFESLADRLRKFYETKACISIPRGCKGAERDLLIIQHNAKTLNDEEIFLLAYVEEEDGNSYRFNQFGQIIMSRGFTYEQYRAFIASITITDEETAEEPASKQKAA